MWSHMLHTVGPRGDHPSRACDPMAVQPEGGYLLWHTKLAVRTHSASSVKAPDTCRDASSQTPPQADGGLMAQCKMGLEADPHLTSQSQSRVPGSNGRAPYYSKSRLPRL